MAKQIVSGKDVLPKILSGVNLIADAVKATLGPDGRNCVYERLGNNLPISTRDGVTVAEQIESADPFENIGINMLKGVAREAVDQSGDGTTTATLLAQAIFAEGVKAVTVGANPVALKRGIEKAAGAVVAGLRGMAQPVHGGMLKQVATISANNDPFLGGLIADAIERAGADGVVTVEVSRRPESSLDVVDGLQFGTGFLAHEFVNRPEKNECVLEDVAIFLHEKKLATILPMRNLLAELAKAGKSLLVIAEDVTDEALGVLAISAKQGPLHCCAVKSPGGLDHLQDIAALTDGKVLTGLQPVKLQDVTVGFLGHAKKVIVRQTSTTIIGDNVKGDALQSRLTELRSQVETATDDGQKMRLQGRLARLVGGIAVIKVGGMTELEMLERKDRIEDAMHATRCAQKEGVLAGGGVALLWAKSCLENLEDEIESDDEVTGVRIVGKACDAPLHTLAANAGESPEYIEKWITSGVSPIPDRPTEFGWNARTGKRGNMFEMGVIDPLRVVRVALESAASVAGLMLITATLCANERPK